MTLHKRSLLLAAAFGLAAAFPQVLPALAADAVSADGTIKITGSWTRATPAGAKVAGGFLSITNTGKEADRLVGGTLVTAGKVEVHEMSMANGVMKMAQLTDGLEIKPGATVDLKPGGYHLMFIDLKAPVKAGETVEGPLVFQRAGTIKVSYDAAAMGASGTGQMKH